MSGLVAANEGPSLFSGAGLLDDLWTTGGSLMNGDWVAAGLMVIPTGIDLLATASDPFGALLAAGLGFVMDHFDPPKKWLDELAGDPGQVLANGKTCGNVATELRRVAGEVERQAAMATVDMEGGAKEAYMAAVKKITDALRAQAFTQDGLKEALTGASSIVTIVRGLVRDAISQIISSVISYAAELVLSLGLATPYIIHQASTKVASWTAKLSGKIKALIESHKMLKGLLEVLGKAWKKLGAAGDLMHGKDFMRKGFPPGVKPPDLPPKTLKEVGDLLKHNAGPLARANAKDYLLKLAIEHPNLLMVNGTYGANSAQTKRT